MFQIFGLFLFLSDTKIQIFSVGLGIQAQIFACWVSFIICFIEVMMAIFIFFYQHEEKKALRHVLKTSFHGRKIIFH